VSHSSNARSDERVMDLSLNVALRLTVVAFLVFWCFMILRPFVIVMLWAVILAVAFEGLYEKINGVLGGRRGPAATLFAILAIAALVVPSYTIGGSLVGSVRSVQAAMAEGTLQAPPPPESLRGIPVVGERAYDAWLLASDDVQQAVVQFEPQLRTAGGWLLGFLAGIGGTVLQTVLALIIAAAFLTYAEPSVRTLRAVTGRIQGDWEEDFVGLAGATINSVARGVLGVALIQAAISGVGLFLVSFPGAGLMTIVMLVVATVQLPGIIVMIFPLIWGFSHLSTIWAIVFAIFCLVAGALDMPLKAMFLGRGVSVPTPVILLGAIGGMVSMGMMGLFIGAIVLGIGYKLFEVWLGTGQASQPQPASAQPAGT